MSRSPRSALLAAVAFTGGALTVWVAAFWTAAGARLDLTTLAGFLGLNEPPVEAMATPVAHLADRTPFALATAAILGLALVRRRPWLACMAGVVLVGANVTAQALKLLTAEPRTVEFVPGAHIASESWPSGHATAAMTLALCLVAVAPSVLRPLAAALGGTFALSVGYSVLVLGWHFPSDVLGGFCVAAAWTAAGVAAVWAFEGRPAPAARDRAPRVESVLAPTALAGLALGAAVGVAALARPEAALAYAQANTAFVATAAVIGSGALALAAALAAVLRS
jgi:membrane-associated phospholipid phosphatase